jgi:hypothetical protein
VDTVAGTWDLSVRTPIGTLAAVYVFTESEGVVSGTATGSGETVVLTDIGLTDTADGLRVTWRQAVTRPLRLNLDFEVIVRGAGLTGFSRAGRLPRSKVTGARQT